MPSFKAEHVELRRTLMIKDGGMRMSAYLFAIGSINKFIDALKG